MNKNLLKTLLLTAIFAMGANSLWAVEGDVTKNVDIDFSNAIATSTDDDGNTTYYVEGTKGTLTIDGSTDATRSTIDDYGRFAIGTGTHCISIDAEEYAGNTDVIELSFEFAFGSCGNWYTGVYLKDASGENVAYFYADRYYSVLSTNLDIELSDFYTNAKVWPLNSDTDYDWSDYATGMTIKIDYANSTITTTCSGYSKSSYSVSLTNNNPVTQIQLVASGTYFSDRRSKIDNIKMTTTEGADAETASYTIKKVDESSNSIDDEVTLSGIVGNSIDLAESYTADFYNDDETIKYIYVSDDSEDQTIASGGSTVVTIVFREADSYSYTIYASVDNSVIQSGSVYEGESVTVYYPKYLCIDGTLYSASSQNSGYYYTLTITADGQSQTISYSATDITDVVFFTEGEDIDGITVISSGNTLIRSSCGKAGYAEEDLTITTLSPGTYTISAAAYASTSTVLTFTIGGEEVYSCTGYGYFYEFDASDEITLTESADLVIASGSGNSNFGLDFIYVQGTVDDTTTGISEAAIESASSDGTIYSLQGVKVSNPSKGLYIQDGKKVIIK